jgi:hypothetical protein
MRSVGWVGEKPPKPLDDYGIRLATACRHQEDIWKPLAHSQLHLVVVGVMPSETPKEPPIRFLILQRQTPSLVCFAFAKALFGQSFYCQKGHQTLHFLALAL